MPLVNSLGGKYGYGSLAAKAEQALWRRWRFRLDARGHEARARLPFAEMSTEGCTYPDAAWRQTPLLHTHMWQSAVLGQMGGLKHVFTPAGYNMSMRVGPDHRRTRNRYKALSEVIGVPFARLTAGTQIHGTIIAVASRSDCADVPRFLDGVDGLVTNERTVPLMALSADCPIVLLVEPIRGVLGVAHSGWRGTVAGMPGCLVRSLQEHFAVTPRDLVAVISPGAGQCCYEIRDDVRVLVGRAGNGNRVRCHDGRLLLDLAGMIADQLATAGVPPSRIHLPNVCSICNEGCYSFRRDGRGTGHAGFVACLV